MDKLSVVLLTENVQDKVRTALESARWADEIIVVDAGSTDNTLQICKEYTDKIFYNPWPGTTTQQWNIAISKASGDWIMLLASDEQIGLDLRSEIKSLLTQNTDCSGFFIAMKNIYLGRWLRHGGLYPDSNIRLFKKNTGKYQPWEHGNLLIDGKVEYLKGHIIHYSYCSLREIMEKLDRYTTLEAKRMFDHNEEFKKRFLLTKPWRGFKKLYFKRRGYKDGIEGFLAHVFSAMYKFIMYAKYWELKHASRIQQQIKNLIEYHRTNY